MSTTTTPAPGRSRTALATSFRRVAGRIVFAVALGLIGALFALPLAWLLVAPFDANPTMAVVVALGTLASYALSRVRIPGRDALLYAMLLLSSIVTGTAAMVPTFQLMNLIGLINTRTGVILVLAGGLLPTVVFILKDFMDSVPRSYEESARLYGAGPGRILADVVIPVARPGIAFVAIWSVVQVWGNFLVPYLLLRDPAGQPAAVLMYTFYTESGQADLRLISVFALVFALPVLAIYFVVNRKFGFRFYGGIKS